LNIRRSGFYHARDLIVCRLFLLAFHSAYRRLPVDTYYLVLV
jgi:hypothetical protein